MTNEGTPLLSSDHADVYDRFPAHRKKALVLIVSLGALVTFFTVGLFVPSIPQIVAELNSTEEVISTGVGISLFANAIGSLIASQYSTFYGRRSVYLWWLPLVVIGSLGVARTRDVTMLMFWLVVQSAGASHGIPIGAGVIGDIYRLEERGTALGIYFCIGLLGYALAPTIGGVTVHYWSWRAIHILLAAFTLVTIITILFFLPETIQPGELSGPLQHA